jgi:SAM-dependent methyltransferase
LNEAAVDNPVQADRRDEIYKDLHSGQLSAEERRNEHSAREILAILFRYLQPASALDVGCGLGTWLKVASEMGVAEIHGIDGPWLDPSRIRVPAQAVEKRDLEKPFDLGRRFDLVICLEVAEHLFEKSAADFIATLTRHAPAVLFSAAIPHQGGHHHVNERFLPYWTELFARHGYRPLDIVRADIWENPEVHWWLRQNAVLFAQDDLIAGNAMLREASAKPRGPLSLVHPEVYASLGERLNGFIRLIEKGGNFQVIPMPNGALQISRLEGTMGTQAAAPAAPNATKGAGIAW